MKYIYYTIALLLTLTACSEYDDTLIKDKIEDFKQRIEVLKQKAANLNEEIADLSYLTNGNVIKSVTKNSDGKYVITYLTAANEEKAVVVATQDDVIEVPILGVRLSTEDNIYYWTLTIDEQTTWLEDESGDKVPVYGHTPEISVDANGYWVVDGTVLLDQYGNPIEVTTDESAVFKAISKTDDGYLKIQLGNGEELNLPIFNDFNLVLNTGAITELPAGNNSLTFTYTVAGADADKAIVSINQAEGLSATINSANKSITVNVEAGFSEGHIIVSAYNLEKLVVRPILFKRN
jgi:hypothetical protein